MKIHLSTNVEWNTPFNHHPCSYKWWGLITTEIKLRKKRCIKNLYRRDSTRSKSTSMSEIYSLLARQKSDKNGPHKPTIQSRKNMTGKEEIREGNVTVGHADHLDTSEGLKAVTWCKCRHMLTCKTLVCTCHKVGRHCTNCQFLGRCNNFRPPHMKKKDTG